MLGSFNQKSLELFQEAMSESMFSDFSEGEFYDFTTCIRPDGSAYGTGGKCRKGTEGKAKEKEAPKRSQVSLVTPQGVSQEDVDRTKRYIDGEKQKLQNLNDSVKNNPEFGKDPEVQKRKKALEGYVKGGYEALTYLLNKQAAENKQAKKTEAAPKAPVAAKTAPTIGEPDRQAAIARISKEKGISAEKAGVEVDKIRMNELNEGVKKYQSMADKARRDGFASRAVSYGKQASELIQERADLQAKAKKTEAAPKAPVAAKTASRR